MRGSFVKAPFISFFVLCYFSFLCDASWLAFLFSHWSHNLMHSVVKLKHSMQHSIGSKYTPRFLVNASPKKFGKTNLLHLSEQPISCHCAVTLLVWQTFRWFIRSRVKHTPQLRSIAFSECMRFVIRTCNQLAHSNL